MAKKQAKTRQDVAKREEAVSPDSVVDLAYIHEQLRSLAVPIADLALDPKNARQHDERNLSAIAASLRNYGIRKPVVVQVIDDQKIVRAGNGTVEAAKLNGWSHVPAVMVVEDDKTATGFALADNRSAELSEWNEDNLRDILEEMDLQGLDEDLFRMFSDLDAEINESLQDAGVGLDENAKHTNRGGSDPKEKTGNPETSAPPDRIYKIVITCKDEAHQLELIDTLHHQGLDVKSLVG